MNEILSNVLIYSLSASIPIVILFYLIKYGISSVLKLIIENIKGLFDFVITEFLRIFKAFTEKASEISTFFNVALIYQHPPRDQIEYISFCVYLIFTTVVLLKKGNVNTDKMIDAGKDIANNIINKKKE